MSWVYYAGTNPDVTRILDEHIAHSDPFTQDFLQNLHELISGRAGTARAIQLTGVEMDQELGRVGGYLQRIGNETNAYGDIISGVTTALEAAKVDDEKFRGVLNHAIKATRKIEDRTRSLEQELEQSAEEVRHLRASLEMTQRAAITDGLTGPANRRHFNSRIVEAIDEVVETEQPGSIIINDIDYFKAFRASWKIGLILSLWMTFDSLGIQSMETSIRAC